MGASRHNLVFWLVLLVPLGLFARVPLPGVHEINLSLYDAALPGLFVYAWLSGRLPPFKRDNIILAAGLILLVVCHAVLIINLEDGIDTTGLARESAKLCVIIAELWTLVWLLGDPTLRRPPTAAILIAFVIATGFTTAEIYHEGFVAGSYDALQTVHASILVGLLLLLLIRLDDAVPRLRVPLLVLIGLMIAALLVMVTKTYLVVTLLVGATILFAWRESDAESRMSVIWISLAVIAILVGAGPLLLRDYPPFSYMHTVGISLGLRLDLWQIAIAAIGNTFPLGSGAGQFGTFVAAATQNKAVSTFAFAHNTPLSLVTEFGIFGLAGAVGIVWLVWRSAASWRQPMRPLILVYLFFPMLLHDALGLRITHIIVALGLASSFPVSPTNGGLPRSAKHST